MLVKSRFRNPDKFIAKLKAELEATRKDLWEEKGKWVKSLNPEDIHLSFWGTCCDDLTPNQTVAVFGMVSEVRKSLEDGKRVSEITFTRTSLRSYR